jgi:hypothetical protein
MRFYTEGLLSKWGFNDGDILDDLLYDHFGTFDEDPHELLIKVVRVHILPKLEQMVEVHEINTIHNPIRATSVNGVKINVYEGIHGVSLTPEYVDIDDQHIVNLARNMWGMV